MLWSPPPGEEAIGAITPTPWQHRLGPRSPEHPAHAGVGDPTRSLGQAHHEASWSQRLDLSRPPRPVTSWATRSPLTNGRERSSVSATTLRSSGDPKAS